MSTLIPHIRHATAGGTFGTPQNLPANIINALRKLELPTPAIGQRLTIAAVNRALDKAGASTRQRMELKSALADCKLID
jgi:hypothetical protein